METSAKRGSGYVIKEIRKYKQPALRKKNTYSRPQAMFNPIRPSGLFYPYQMDGSTQKLRVVKFCLD